MISNSDSQSAASRGALQAHVRLVQALDNASLYPHPLSAIETIETHISSVLTTRAYAYKIKKPVNLGFID
jgi:aminoglycoside phosphotransferase family enzyme